MAQRYRQLSGPVPVETSVPSTGAADLSQMLASAAKGIQQKATAIGQDIVFQEGKKQGTADGLAGSPKKLSGFAAATPYGRGYASAAEAAYVAKTTADVDITISSIEQQHPDSVHDFSAAVGGYARTMMEEVPEEHRPIVANAIRAKLAASGLRIRANEQALTGQQNLASYLAGAESAIDTASDAALALPGEEGDKLITEYVAENRRRLDVLVRERVITPVKAKKYDSLFIKNVGEKLTDREVALEVGKLRTVIDKDSLAAADAMQRIRERTDLTDAQKDDIFKGYRAADEESRFLRVREYYKDITSLAERIAADGTGSQLTGEVDRLQRLNAISPDEAESYRASIARNAKTLYDKQQAANKIKDEIVVGGKLDPYNTKHVKWASDSFDLEMRKRNFMPGTPAYLLAAKHFFFRTQVVPKVAASWANSSLVSTNPLDVAQGAKFLSEIEAINPTAFAALNVPPAVRGKAALVNMSLGAGIDPQTAVESAERLINVTPDARKLRVSEYSKDSRKVAAGNFTALRGLDAFEDIAPNKLPLELRAEYERNVRNNFILTGDMEVSREMAGTTAASTWRAHTINGEQEVVKWAPQMSSALIRDDIDEKMKGVLPEGHTAHIVSAPRLTDLSYGASWYLEERAKDGTPKGVVRDPKTNLPLQYVIPDVAEAKAAEARIRQRAAEEAAKDQREDAAAREGVRTFVEKRQENDTDYVPEIDLPDVDLTKNEKISVPTGPAPSKRRDDFRIGDDFRKARIARGEK